MRCQPPPATLEKIKEKCRKMAFDMASDEMAGSLLCTLAAGKPKGRFLELGTGIGASLCWILAGMDDNSHIISVDNDQSLINATKSILGSDSRLELICEDGEHWIKSYSGESFDFIFADAWPGKYHYLEETLSLLKPGGYYLVDDMIPQPNWPPGHDEKASALLSDLTARSDLRTTFLEWSTGILICAKI